MAGEQLHSDRFTKTYNILFVEDDRVLNHLVKIYSKNLFNLDGVFDAESALGKLIDSHYDLFLLDINLGEGMNGIELLRRIRQHENYKNAPAIAATAYAMKGDKEYLLSQGFNGYLPKPFTKTELLDYIQIFLK